MNRLISFFFVLALLIPNALLPARAVAVTTSVNSNPSANNTSGLRPIVNNPSAGGVPSSIEAQMKELEKNLPKNIDVQQNVSAKFEHIESNDPIANFRTKIINEELAKVKIPTETTDELLFLATVKEKESLATKTVGGLTPVINTEGGIRPVVNTETSGDLRPVVNTDTLVGVKNNSNLTIECVLTALHTTSGKTALFSRKYNKYIMQTAVSVPVTIRPQAIGMLTVDLTGANIANTETVIAITVSAVQISSKKHILERANYRNETILVHDIITNSWISNKKIEPNRSENLDFPNNFVLGLTQTQSHEGPNYYNLIAYMRACEKIYESSSEQVEFPAEYFNPNYIGRLDEKELNNLYQFIMKKFNQKSIPMPVGLTGLLNCGKYNFVAKAIGQIFLSVVLMLTGGFGFASLAADAASTIQTIVDSSIAIGQGVGSLKAKGRG